MTARLDPLISEFETDDQAVSYDLWFRTKVREAIDSPEPRIPHDEAMAQVDRMLAEKRAKGVDRSMEP